MALFIKTSFLLSRSICIVNSRKYYSNQNWSQLSVVPYRDKSIEYVKHKFNTALTWYEEISGLREVREAQTRVLMATESMKSAQENRRNAKSPINEQQKRLQDLQPELRNTPRDDDAYLYLIKEEHGLLKNLKLLQERVQTAENEERESFEELMTSLRSSHEAERVQAEKTKYWSIILSITATIIGIIGSNINNRYKMRELKSMLNQSNVNETNNNNSEELFCALHKIENKVDYLSKIKSRAVPHVVTSNEETTLKHIAIGVIITTVIFWLFRS